MAQKVIFNGKVYVDKGHYEEAILIEDNMIRLVGTNEEILGVADADAEKFDVKGQTVVPGFNDSHMHLTTYGFFLIEPPIAKAKSVEEIIEICKQYRKDHPYVKKIFARGWNEDLFYEGQQRVPTREDMDKIATDIPVLLRRVCGHSAAANSLALEMAGITKDTVVPGGKIDHDENGEPNGVLYENAQSAVRFAMPGYTPDEIKEATIAGTKSAATMGITTVQTQDMGNNFDDADNFFNGVKAAYDCGEAPIRFVMQVGADSMEGVKRYVLSDRFKKKYGLFEMGGLKMFKDGSLGARSGLCRNDYADDPGNKGVEVIPDDKQQEIVDYATKHGLQVLTHVICDAAVEQTAKIYAAANAKINDYENKARHCLIHCQITDKPLMEFIAKNNIYISYQPVFLEYDIMIIDARVGKELGSTSYAHKTAYDLGIHYSYGTDCPVESCNPLNGLYCTVTRKMYNHQPEGGWNPQECVDIETAVDNYTIDSAYQESKEDYKGRIKPGYLADIAVFDKDLFTMDPETLMDAKCVLTLVDGKVVYQA